jgi:hypothetical protein
MSFVLLNEKNTSGTSTVTQRNNTAGSCARSDHFRGKYLITAVGKYIIHGSIPPRIIGIYKMPGNR